MLNKLFAILFGNYNAKIINQFKDKVRIINSLEEQYIQLTDDELKQKTVFLKNLLNQGKTLDNILPEAFALVREASKRTLGQRHFDVQLIGGMVLHSHMIAEMLTGEGKTLVSTLPAYLNALTGKGVHIITVNDYLAKRDSEWMGVVFKFLGLSVGVIYSNMTQDERKKAYECDITYGTNNEFSFDYLRDNMQLNPQDVVQKSFNYAIIDEVDSVLIDEARVPLIISGPTEDKANVYKILDSLVASFIKNTDFIIDEKAKSLTLTEVGITKAEKILADKGLSVNGSLFDNHNIQLYHLLLQSLKAHYFFTKDVDYVVKEGQVVIIDEFTGRMMDGRRFSDGMHQALEAKEKLKIKQENQTLASITFQNYFKLYPKLSGMTGTAMTESKEFLDIYGLKVIQIPTNIEVTRKDYNDLIYLTVADKDNAILEKVKELYEKKQPVLIGTISIERSEKLSSLFTKNKIKHNVLNAKHHDKEANIIAQAGVPGSVTIATNMAGRGTDIKLGGNANIIALEKGVNKLAEDKAKIEIQKIESMVEEDKKLVISLGGLFVIGTERHESRRIDNQLRGRSGRQGEIGASIFYISLEDDLMRIFGSNKLQSTLKTLGFKPGESISHSMISKSIERAQKKVEQHNFEIRKNLLKFDNVINEQRVLIYEKRKEIMNKEIEVLELIEDSVEDSIDKIVETYCSSSEYKENWNIEGLKSDSIRLLNISHQKIEEIVNKSETVLDIKSELLQYHNIHIKLKIENFGESLFKDVLSSLTLQLLDYGWKNHLLELDYVRSSINLRAYANKDPFNEYQKESFILFTNMLSSFKEKLVSVSHYIQKDKEK
jgi:preprotein translocase subunit SecA